MAGWSFYSRHRPYRVNDEDADVLYEELVRYEHEHDLDPFDMDICLQQLDWGKTHHSRAKPCS